MKIHKSILIITLLLISIFACTQQDNTEKEYEHFMATVDSFYTYVNSGNTEARAALFASEALILTPNGNPIRFNESVKETWLDWDKDWIFRIKDVEHIEVEIGPEFAYTVNTYYYTWHAKGEKAKWVSTKNVHIWEKQANGNWKLKVDIWNNFKR